MTKCAFVGMFSSGRSFALAFAVVFAIPFVVNGTLLALRPDLFLRFYDLLNPGDYVAKTAGWRRDIDKFEYRLLGAAFVVVGLLILGLIGKLLGTP